jgi:hypothetical protein
VKAQAMADRKGLAIIGIILASVTAAITTVGVVVVQWHVEGRLSFSEAPPILGDVTPGHPLPSAATKYPRRT